MSYFRPSGFRDAQLVSQFLEKDCACKLGPNGKQCVTHFDQNHIFEHLSNCWELTKEELDMGILGQLNALSTIGTISPWLKRRQISMTFRHSGHIICKDTFLFLHGIGKRKFENLQAHFISNGLSQCTYGNTCRLPHNVTSEKQIQRVEKFMCNHGTQQRSLPTWTSAWSLRQPWQRTDAAIVSLASLCSSAIRNSLQQWRSNPSVVQNIQWPVGVIPPERIGQ